MAARMRFSAWGHRWMAIAKPDHTLASVGNRWGEYRSLCETLGRGIEAGGGQPAEEYLSVVHRDLRVDNDILDLGYDRLVRVAAVGIDDLVAVF